MSGGVDSSVAATRLVEEGYEVIGVHMQLWSEREQSRAGHENELSGRARADAEAVARILEIPFHVVDYSEPFRRQVVDFFLGQYARGRTPNPCLVCNRRIKLGLLFERSLQLGADYLATGHYARVRLVGGEYQLWRGVDRSKDQSYVLYMLGQRDLRRLLLPLGGYTKDQVRTLARERGLPTESKAESQDLCFLSGNDYRRFLRERIPEAVLPGPILDTGGRVLGQHKGLPFYTVGQRKGLNISASEPLYVIALYPERNALTVGTASELGSRELLADGVTFVSGHWPAGPLRVAAKIRYRARMALATVTPLPDQRARVTFEESLRDITPGQAVVFYHGDILLGGGIIGDQHAPESA
jgi:tRNA-specific 2-thiouridylase